ncbi:hypothetical protein R6Q59_020789 [Mikania micrantha]
MSLVSRDIWGQFLGSQAHDQWNQNKFECWKSEPLSPVGVPAAAWWKFRSKPFEQIILDYDYPFTTPYSGSQTVETNRRIEFEGNNCLKWEDCEEQINLAQLASKEPILFYDELRVDDVLMRSRDTLASESILLLSNSKTC